MADASTCELTPSHSPKPPALKSFTALLPTIKHELIKLRHKHDKHEPQYFKSVSHLSDQELTSFTEKDLVAVRSGKVAYGVIVFGKVRIPALSGAYVFVRWFVGGVEHDHEGIVDKEGVEYRFHSIYTEEKKLDDGLEFRAIMGEKDELEFFNE